MKEIWKDVPGYEGYYQASSLGNIKSFNWRNTGREKILIQHDNGRGYCRIILNKNKNPKSFGVHRLIIASFLGKNKLEVNHIDGNKKNNCIENLEYCTRSENIKHGLKNGLYDIKRGIESIHCKKVGQYDLKGNLVKKWNFIGEASIMGRGFSVQNISCCLNGKQKTAGGFIWKYL